MTIQAALIGLGSMGGGIAAALLAGNIAVSGYDPNPQATALLASRGGLVSTSAREAAHNADIVILVVVNAQQTRDILSGADGIAEIMKPGSVIVSCATMSPDEARGFAAHAQALKLHYLDAPISGGAAKALSGELTVMASGTPQAFAAARPALDAMATKVHELGDEAGIGAAFKVVNQLLAGVHIAAACEAIVFAKKLGLDIAKVYEVITGSAGNSWMFENRVPHVLDGDYTPRSAIDIFTKDLGIVTDIGRQQKFPLPVSATALQLFVMTAAAGMGRDDDASVARLLARISGLDLPGAPAQQE